jgi:hypothetical protein
MIGASSLCWDDKDLTQLVAARKEDEIDDGSRVFAFLTDRFAEIL